MSKCLQCGKTMRGFDSVGLICSQCKTNNDLRDSVKDRGVGNSNDGSISFIPVFIFFFSFIKYSNRLLTYYGIGLEMNIIIKGVLYLFLMFPIIFLYHSIELFLEKLFVGGKYLLYVYVLYLTYDLIKPWF